MQGSTSNIVSNMLIAAICTALVWSIVYAASWCGANELSIVEFFFGG